MNGIKGLLTAIDGGMYLVNSGLPKNDQQRVREGWDIVQRNVGSVRSMMLDILYYAKNRDFDLEPLESLELAAEVAACVAYRAQELSVEFCQDLSTAAGRMTVDPNALRTAVVNILENAFDACRLDRKKAAHQVSFTLAPDGDFVVFEVSDNGVGMPEALELGESKSLGLQLIPLLAEQFGCELHVKQGIGLRYELRFRFAT